MFARTLLRGGSYNAQRFTAFFVNGMSSRQISTYAADRFHLEWQNPKKLEIAKNITLATIVSTAHYSRVSAPVEPPLAPGKMVHSSVLYAHGSTYGQLCAVDKVPAVCPEHLFLMRTAIGTTRNPSKKILQSSSIIASVLGEELAKLDSKTLASIFEVGSNVKESRSQDVLENQRELLRILRNPQQVPPQKLLRVLEVALSPLGMIANSYGGTYCKVAQAKREKRDIGDLERFMELVMMPSLALYHTPYIKAPGSPYAHLQMRQYAQGADISCEERVTINHYLECCAQKDGVIPTIPQLRSVVVKDPTGRSIHLHDHLNLPHFFDVSGTTGAVMQAALGLLRKAGKSDLVDSPEATIRLGMVLAGCNFYKQGYHNYYEVLPALHWVNHHVWKQTFVEMTPMELLHAVPETLKECVEPTSSIAPVVCDTLDLVTEHFELHYELYKKDLKEQAKKEKAEAEVSVPTPSGS